MNVPCRLPPSSGARRLLSLPLILIAACAPALYPVPEHPEGDPGILLARMEARQAGLSSLSAAGRAESRSREGTLRGRVTVLADARGRIRLDAWTSTDVLVAVIGAGPGGFTYVQRGSPTCLVGPTCPANLGRFLPRGWDLVALSRALMGIAPVRPPEGAWRLEFDRKVGAYRLESDVAEGGVQRLWLREDGAAVRYERGRAGAPVLRLDVPEPGTAPGQPARRIRLKAGRGESELAVRYDDSEANPDLLEDDWSVECPDGTGVRVLPCEGEP